MPSKLERAHRQRYIDEHHPLLQEIPRPDTCLGCVHYMGAKIMGIDLVCGYHPKGHAGLYCPQHQQSNPNTEWDLQ
jgi:hypothetical protein